MNSWKNPTSPLGAGGLDDSSSFCLQIPHSPEPWGGVYPSPFPLPRGLTWRCVTGSRSQKSVFGEIRPISKIYCKTQYKIAFFTWKNGPRGATVSETFLLALELMLKSAPSAPTSFLGSPKRPPRGPQEAAKRGLRGPKRPPGRLQEGFMWLPRSAKGAQEPRRSSRRLPRGR